MRNRNAVSILLPCLLKTNNRCRWHCHWVTSCHYGIRQHKDDSSNCLQAKKRAIKTPRRMDVSHSVVRKKDQEKTQTLWHVTSTHAVGLSCLTVSLQSTHKSLTYLIHAEELIQVMSPKLDQTIRKFSWLNATSDGRTINIWPFRQV